MNQSYNRVAVNGESIKKLDALIPWKLMEVPDAIPQGDMPGDKIEIGEEHIRKANIIFSELLLQLKEVLKENPYSRAVLTVCGGSGVGKSEIASLLSYFFRQSGIGSYTLSGDNYPHRIPKYNDAERLRIFRESVVRGMVEAGVFTQENFKQVQEWQKAEDDADPMHVKECVWYKTGLEAGKKGLEGYLGTEKEIDFKEIEQIVSAFRDGAEKIWLKRMGRDEASLWYEEVDFSDTQILIIEWTHGNSDNYQGVDIPILLNSTPQETLAHRRARNRDGKTDSAFTMLVLEIEQNLLRRQAGKAKLILSKNGELLTYEDYCKRMEESEAVK